MRVRRSFVLLVLLGTAACLPWGLLGRDTAPAGVEPVIEVKDDVIEFRNGKSLFTRYAHGEKVAKPYFWPIYALEGKAITRAWPMADDPEVKKGDHPHQKSLWFCHGDVVPEGLDYVKHHPGVVGIDFWSEGKGHGKIVCVKVEKPKVSGD